MTIESRVNENVIYKKLYDRWYQIKRRCYDINHPRYKSYGGAGIVMCEKWKSFDGFLDDVDLIDGFDLELIIKGELVLDKDSVDFGNKVYCLEKCRFITKEENNKYKPNQQKYIIATMPTGEKVEFFNQCEFARQNGLRQSSIGDCLSGKCNTHKGWKFKYK